MIFDARNCHAKFGLLFMSEFYFQHNYLNYQEEICEQLYLQQHIKGLCKAHSVCRLCPSFDLLPNEFHRRLP